jgi:hypothetical protein
MLKGSSSGGSTYNVTCTGGIPAYNAKGTPGLFTAGHCFGLTSHTFSSSTLSGGSNTGRVSHSYTMPTVDAEFISGKTYTASIFAGLGTSTLKPVKGTYYPEPSAANNYICFTGTTSGYSCGNRMKTYSTTFCTNNQCRTPVFRMADGITSAGGDSGGPVFANFGNTVKVTGIILGHSGTSTYGTRWSTIASAYSATLMLG